MERSYTDNEEYKEGYVVGMVNGEKDANVIVTPYPHTNDGSEFYQLGYMNGYFMRYAQGLSAILKQNPNKETTEIIAIRLEEISESMKLENEKINGSTK